MPPPTKKVSSSFILDIFYKPTRDSPGSNTEQIQIVAVGLITCAGLSRLVFAQLVYQIYAYLLHCIDSKESRWGSQELQK